jgi:isoquinoline 1-oxidoreductase subunit beta
MRLQRLGATAHLLLIRAAAAQWAVPEAELEAADSAVHHRRTKRRLGYGALVASRRVNRPYTLLGTRVGGVDNRAIVTGKPLFGIDVQLSGLLVAVLESWPMPTAR